MNIRYKFANFLLKGGVNTMVAVYTTLILNGKKTIDDVPVIIREKVKEMLKDLEIEI